MIRAVIFDLDGTIHDSRDAVFYCLEKTLQDNDLPVPSRADMAIHIHAGPEHFFGVYAPREAVSKLAVYFRDIYKTERDKILPYEDAKRVFTALRKLGLELAVVSSARSAEESLAAHELQGYFKTIVSGNSTTARKPDPEPVHIALRELEVLPHEVVMVGDLPADIEAGKAAGVKMTIALTHGFGSRAMLAAAKPDFIIDSLDELLRLLLELAAPATSKQ